MKRVINNILFISLSFSFVLIFIEYIQYYSIRTKLSNVKDDYYETSNNLTYIYDDIHDLKLEKENISKEKEKQLIIYQKWENQNRILEDLLK